MSAPSTLAPVDLVAVLGAGLLAGLGVAVPLGAVGVLLLQEGLARGRRGAVLGATGIAVVDLGYAVVAVLAGGAVTTALAGRQDEVRLVSGLVLAGLALVGLAGTVRGGRSRRDARAAPAPAPAPVPTRAVGSFWRFVALTALNPLTAVYFTALAAGLGDRLATPATATAFVVGVFVGSLAWQLVLALVGSGIGSRLTPVARTWTSVAGYGLVLALGVGLVVTL
jgi:threonine/homoserine/homoserine lactone efflux protein